MWNTSFVYLTGVLHVGMTSFCYLDPEMRQFRRERPHLFITWPILIGLSAAFALTVPPVSGRAVVNIASAVWLGWHYTGQQVGVVAMALKGEVSSARLRSRERTFIRWTAAVTIVGLVRSAAEPAPGGGRRATRAVSLVWATAFVSPVVFLGNPIVATATIAAVHSLHYVFLVAHLSGSRRH